MYDDYDDYEVFDGDGEDAARFYQDRAAMIRESQKNDTCGCARQPCAHYQ
jgi:hypothetical protein